MKPDKENRGPSVKPKDLAVSGEEGTHIPRDTHMFSCAEMQWQFGEWESLVKLQAEYQPEELQHQPKRAELALYIAAAHLQIGSIELAKKLIDQATQWGANRDQLNRILISGAYNSLARVAILGNQQKKSDKYFEQAITVGMPGSDVGLLSDARANQQRAQVKQIRKSTDPARHTYQHKFPLPDLLQRLDKLVVGLYRDGTAFELDGNPCFDGRDPFLTGKVMLALAYHATEYPANHPATSSRCQHLAALSEQFDNEPIKTWGIYFYLKTLVMLQEADVLNKCFDGSQLKKFQETLDWRTFIDPDSYKLTIKASNNFYGIGYAIAVMRYKLDWESSTHSEQLLELLQKHYQEFSGQFGFADETDGHGRYDRYSFLLIAEIAHYLREAGQSLTAQLAEWLRRSCEVVLHNINMKGDGFAYGRSIGAYGDTAFIEILSAAAAHGLLSLMEIKVAYTFSYKVSRKFIDYWWDESNNRVNLWYKGRKIDAYRGAHRALGETISLLHQHIYVHQLWQSLKQSELVTDKELEDWIQQRPKGLLTRFSEGEHSRALLSVADGVRRFNIPFVNGHQFHAESSYFPIPYAQGMVQGVPGKSFPQLTPKINLVDGTVLMPITWYKNISMTSNQDRIRLTWVTSEMDDPTARLPNKNNNLTVRSSYNFTEGCFSRVDRVIPKESIPLSNIEMELALFSSGAKLKGHTILFETGDVYKVCVRGYKVEKVIPIDNKNYETVEGPLKTLVRLVYEAAGLKEPVECEIKVYYR